VSGPVSRSATIQERDPGEGTVTYPVGDGKPKGIRSGVGWIRSGLGKRGLSLFAWDCLGVVTFDYFGGSGAASAFRLFADVLGGVG
jgi:hypothetical protein